MTPADLNLIEQGYRRGYVPWERVAQAVTRTLPPCTRCGAPGALGSLREDEPLCLRCFEDVIAERDAAAGRLTDLSRW